MDKLTDAIQTVADEYGVKRIAADMGVNYNVLLNQLNPNNGRPISLSKFYQMVRFTQDIRTLQPLLDELGMVAVKATRNEDEDASLCDLVLNHSLAFGTLSGEIHKALADGKIDHDEIKRIKAAMQEELQSMTALVGELEDMVQPAKPKLAKA